MLQDNRLYRSRAQLDQFNCRRNRYWGIFLPDGHGSGLAQKSYSPSRGKYSTNRCLTAAYGFALIFKSDKPESLSGSHRCIAVIYSKNPYGSLKTLFPLLIQQVRFLCLLVLLSPNCSRKFGSRFHGVVNGSKLHEIFVKKLNPLL